ncbi:uncharacterized protein LOC117333176 [Pecten maximus]|uniref:uncharacterized protein LOC117333176 n=1 Tax=Pecten maximus TaxID=6579 RepID=UPI00145914CD|nr:uncharacterized protein LOC117333176 [Pecten maximus]
MNTFVTHASVRIKGTENNYNPAPCYDQMCSNKSAHMHCPFCVKSDIYQDPVILKAHYRVKHVDKGIDFAGLKILRCCDHCDIVGVIKGEKKFKGAHWHCYRCRNGFNRRDEAIKHYKTHFRNPQTTFQIQVAQEVNNPNSGYCDSTATLDQGGISIHPALTEAVMSSSLAQEAGLMTQPQQVSVANGKVPEGSVHVSVAANETVDTSDGQTHHIMIIQEEPIENNSNSYTTQIITSEDVRMVEEKEQPNHQNAANKLEELQQKYQQLEAEKDETERILRTEILSLKSQVETLGKEVLSYQKREEELLEQVSVPLDRNIETLLKNMETQHRDLLHQQLLVIKREYKPQTLLSNVVMDGQLKPSPKTNCNIQRYIIECNQDQDSDPTADELDDPAKPSDLDPDNEAESPRAVMDTGEESSLQGNVEDTAMSDSHSDVSKALHDSILSNLDSTQRGNLSFQLGGEGYSYCVAGESDGKTDPKNNPLVVCIEYPSDVTLTPVENTFKVLDNYDASQIVQPMSIVNKGDACGEPDAKRQKPC